MVPCPLCSMPLPVSARGVEELVFCTGCRRDVTVVGWPALDRAPERAVVPRMAEAGEAPCFSCADKVATGVCEGCGCYTCPACEAPWFGESLCLTCLHARRELQSAPRFRNRALLHDNIALMLLVLPILCIPFYGFFFSALASPVALFLVIRHRRAPRGLPPRGPFRLLLAGGLAVVLMLTVVFGIGAVIYSAIAINDRIASLPEAGEAGEVAEAAEAGEVGKTGGDAEGPSAEDDP